MYFHCKRFRRWLSGKSIDYFEDVFSNRDFHCTCQYCQRIPIYSYPPGNWHIPGKVNFEDDYPLSSLEGTPKTLCNMWFWLIREDHTHLIHISHGSQRTPSSRFHLGIISVQLDGAPCFGWSEKAPVLRGPDLQKTEVMAGIFGCDIFLELFVVHLFLALLVMVRLEHHRGSDVQLTLPKTKKVKSPCK